jgi:hypothetical protein
MQGIAGLLVLLGAGSFVLKYMDMEFTVISWIDKWGVNVGNGIRIAMIVVGVILFFLGRKSGKSESSAA